MNEIKNKLVAAFIFITFTISILYGLLVYNAMKYTEDDILTRRLVLEAANYLKHVEQAPDTALLPNSIGLTSYLSSSPDLPRWLKEQPLGTRELHTLEKHVGVFAIPNTDQKLYIALNELDTSNLESETPVLILMLTGVGVLITFTGLMLGLFFSSQISKPIILLTQDVASRHANDEAQFYGQDRHDEVGALSQAFSHLVIRLQSFITREKKFTQYVSHEFRTPLSLVKNAIAVLRLPEQNKERFERNINRIESATIEMESLINTFLCLGREGTKSKVESIDVIKLLKHNLKRNALANQNKKLDIALNLENELTIDNDQNLLNILIDNIVRNIFIHGESKAKITLVDNVIIFENNIANTTFNDKESQATYGLEIIHELADKMSITVSSEITNGHYVLKIVF